MNPKLTKIGAAVLVALCSYALFANPLDPLLLLLKNVQWGG